MKYEAISIEVAIELANRMTYERLRVEAMGWKFSRINVRRDEPFGWVIEGSFTCVCGRQEMFRINGMSTFPHPEDYDVAFRLKDSFTREHLLGDGYTEEQIYGFMQRGTDFDRIMRQHWEPIVRRELQS